MARKYARKSIHGHHLLREANRITYSTYTQCDSNSECYHAFFDKPFILYFLGKLYQGINSFLHIWQDLYIISKTKLNLRLSWCQAAYHMKHSILYVDSQVVFAVEREICWKLTFMCHVILRGCSFFLFPIVIATVWRLVFSRFSTVSTGSSLKAA